MKIEGPVNNLETIQTLIVSNGWPDITVHTPPKPPATKLRRPPASFSFPILLTKAVSESESGENFK